jgi:hypothetical protein
VRTTKELLQLVLKELEKSHLFKTGLCALIGDMAALGIIDYHEENVLWTYIRKYGPPHWYSKRYFQMKKNRAYYWPFAQAAPRIAWIKKRIKQCKN